VVECPERFFQRDTFNLSSRADWIFAFLRAKSPNEKARALRRLDQKIYSDACTVEEKYNPNKAETMVQLKP
jgi:hypothetical protein